MGKTCATVFSVFSNFFGRRIIPGSLSCNGFPLSTLSDCVENEELIRLVSKLDPFPRCHDENTFMHRGVDLKIGWMVWVPLKLWSKDTDLIGQVR